MTTRWGGLEESAGEAEQEKPDDHGDKPLVVEKIDNLVHDTLPSTRCDAGLNTTGESAVPNKRRP